MPANSVHPNTPDPAFADLLTPDVQAFIRAHLADDVTQLALRAKQFPGLPLPDVLQQLSARQKAKDKLPTWYTHEDVLFPSLVSLEQSSSEVAAAYKARRVSGQTLVDLTGGFGVDAFFFAQRCERVIYVERHAELSALAAHNFRVLGADRITCVNQDAEAFLAQLSEPVDWLYLDPARRDQSRGKVFRLEDCEPDVLRLRLLDKAHRVLIKTSPMLDLDLAIDQLGAVVAVTVLAVENEVKEVLYELAAMTDGSPVITAVNLPKTGPPEIFAFTRGEERAATATYAEPQTYLYEPNAALLKAGAFQTVAERFGLRKLHPHTHLYTSEALRTHFPGRIFACQAVTKLNAKALRPHLPEGKAHVAVRNFPLSVAEIRRQTGIREGGSVYLFAATDPQGRRIVVVTRKVGERS